MISLIDAQRCIAALALPPRKSEALALEEALGRVLAVAPASDLDLPPFDRVTMDGYAVRAAEAGSGAALLCVGTLAAGGAAGSVLPAGAALKIMTGAPLPAGADAVVPIEESLVAGDRVRFTRAPRAGQNIHPRGVDLRRGGQPLRAGTRVTAAVVPLLATLGCRRVTVGAAPTVAILTTGDELVEPDVLPTGSQIRDSNRFALAAQVRTAAAHAAIRPIVRDDRAAIRTALQAALEADVVLLTGGSSVGEFDFSKGVVEALGGKLWFEQVAIKPGKPVLLFTVGTRFVFCLPGNPVSAFVTFELLVRPLLERLSGASAVWPVPGDMPVSARVAAPPERDLLQVARVARAGAAMHAGQAGGGLVVEPVRWSGSGDLVAIAHTNALVHVRQGEACDAGQMVPTLLLRNAWDDLPRADEPIA